MSIVYVLSNLFIFDSLSRKALFKEEIYQLFVLLRRHAYYTRSALVRY